MKFKIYISDLVLDSYEFTPAAYVKRALLDFTLTKTDYRSLRECKGFLN
jgi:hypothetical protein